MKKVLSIILAVVMVLSLAACGTMNVDDKTLSVADSAYVADNGKLIVGITEYAPMDFLDENGEWTGFDAEFATLFAEDLGVEVEFKVIEWDNKFLELEAKAIDCIWNGMTITNEVNLNTSCSDPYVKNAQVVVMAADKLANYADVASMADLTFAVESGSAGEAVAIDNGLTTVAVTAQSDALLEVSSGSADACVIDITMANAMTGEGTSYADLGYAVELATEEYGVGFRKDSDLTAKLNTFMAELKDDGTLQTLADKYELTLA